MANLRISEEQLRELIYEYQKTKPNLRNNLQKSVYTGLFLLEIPIFG